MTIMKNKYLVILVTIVSFCLKKLIISDVCSEKCIAKTKSLNDRMKRESN